MSEAASPAPRHLLRRLLKFAAILVGLLLLLVLLAGWLMQPQRAGSLLLGKLGDSLGLQLSAQSINYRLRGTPQLVLHGLKAQRAGDANAVLRADRVFVSLPWRTLRARGSDLTVQRVELDGPVLDLPALQRWLASRPATGETRLPTLVAGLRIRDGELRNDDWRINGLDVDLDALYPDRPLQAHVRGRYLAPPMSIPADLAIAVVHPARVLSGAPTGVAGVGGITVAEAGWRVPMQVFLAGPLQLGKDFVLMRPAKLGVAARYLSSSTQLPFRLGLHGPMAFNNATWRFVPVSVVLDGDGVIPDAGARGSVAIGKQLRLHLDGRIAGWPDAWPALPAPLAASTSPLPFALEYRGGIGFGDIAALEARRDATRFEARFRLPDVLAWTEAAATGSLLPPLDGRLTTPRLQIAGAQLEGVEIDIDAPSVHADSGTR